jgi:REP-associated tyrosine transposase
MRRVGAAAKRVMNNPPPIIAYHIVFGAYGFWLPNDPRGSWSKYVWTKRLQPFGRPEPVRAGYEPTIDDELRRLEMKRQLCYPAVRFSGEQALVVANGFAEIIHRLGLVIYAAAIVPDHVHLVAARQEMHAETIAGYLKRAAARKLRKENVHPLAAYRDSRGRLPSPWVEHGWKVFLHTPEEIELAILYVTNNPLEAGLRAQRWSWIKPYDA